MHIIKSALLQTARRSWLSALTKEFYFRRLPFGIKSAPGYFQEIMEQLTKNLREVAVYFDDILVSGDNAKDHLMNLRALFKRLEEKGLRCNREKCVFAQVAIDYLGHTLSRQGIAKGSKVDAILEMPTPKNIFTLKSFLHLCNFIPNSYLHIFRKSPSRCTSLHAKDNSGSGVKKKLLLSKRSNGYSAQIRFLLTMTRLFRWVYLVTPQNAELELYYFIALQTEASVRFSILSATQKRYSQIQKEALSLVYALKKFHQFLYGRKFIVVTDHKPLVTLFAPDKALLCLRRPQQSACLRFKFFNCEATNLR